MNQRHNNNNNTYYRKVLWGREILFLLFSPFFAFFAKVVGTPNKQLLRFCVFFVCSFFFLANKKHQRNNLHRGTKTRVFFAFFARLLLDFFLSLSLSDEE